MSRSLKEAIGQGHRAVRKHLEKEFAQSEYRRSLLANQSGTEPVKVPILMPNGNQGLNEMFYALLPFADNLDGAAIFTPNHEPSLRVDLIPEEHLIVLSETCLELTQVSLRSIQRGDKLATVETVITAELTDRATGEVLKPYLRALGSSIQFVESMPFVKPEQLIYMHAGTIYSGLAPALEIVTENDSETQQRALTIAGRLFHIQACIQRVCGQVTQHGLSRYPDLGKQLGWLGKCVVTTE